MAKKKPTSQPFDVVLINDEPAEHHSVSDPAPYSGAGGRTTEPVLRAMSLNEFLEAWETADVVDEHADERPSAAVRRGRREDLRLPTRPRKTTGRNKT